MISPDQLPIFDVIPEIQERLARENTLVLHAPPGAGKSTVLPLYLTGEEWLKGKKILMLEPRRLAAVNIAHRMAGTLGEQVGTTVGYRIRFDHRVSQKTKIEVLTEGILNRMIHHDNALEEIGMVIFDEFHERSLFADVGLALCREIQQILRPDLRILVMSATLDTSNLTNLLGCSSVSCRGKQYPVETIYTENTDLSFLSEYCIKTIHRAMKEQEGDVLVFLPGQGEIRRVKDMFRTSSPDIAVYPLYGQLPLSKQQAAILPHPSGKRKVVLATSIAETSLTIEGIKVIIDSGYTRSSQFDPKSGLSKLVTSTITKDAADQRAGRAGRLGPGTCYRMWTKASHEKLLPFRKPEILEADLTYTVLDLVKWGKDDLNDLCWLTPPPEGAVAQAFDLLHQLDALENGKITAHGQAMHNLPCHPRIAHMLLRAQGKEEQLLAADLAAILEEKDPLPESLSVDVNLRIEALRRFRKESGKNKKFLKIEKVSEVYRKLLHLPQPDNGPVDPYNSGKLLALAFPERIAAARPGNRAQFQLANGKTAFFDHRDDLSSAPWIAVAQMDARDYLGKIFLASPLDPTDLRPFVKQEEEIYWENQKGLQTNLAVKIGHIKLQTKPLPNPDPKLVENLILKVLREEGERLLAFDQDIQNWQNRVLSLKIWNPAQDWPDVSIQQILDHADFWLAGHLDRLKSPDDMRKLNLMDILPYRLDYALQGALTELAPERLTVPSGSNIKLQYSPHGDPPVLSVRLQELFGLMETPRVNHGKIPILIHLLSPGFKPVQVTKDLKSFWNQTYHEVKKELKRRYPKHYWPDDPFAAEAVRGVRRQG
ncbi:ATP-dependent helicase HrpB [Negadavirga shengliensis]|uniref:ATP-dependent helicase HrpB n=1 Tax=Negadavirga shengliensis TaxID=1389218 RepID=A0ABV9T3V2_9BACT